MSFIQAATICGVLALGFIFPFATMADPEELISIHEWIENEHPNVEHIDGDLLSRSIEESSAADRDKDIVLFDVRKPSEYQVSHLQDAIWVDPDISAKDFHATYADQLANKTVVFYCSVGRRSSLLAEKVQDSLIAAGSKKVLNLEQGIFGWHNESRQLMRGDNKTDFVHPYSWRWDDLIARQDLIRYDPQ